MYYDLHVRLRVPMFKCNVLRPTCKTKSAYV